MPQNVSAVETGETMALVSWSASADNLGVAGYQVFRDGALLGTSVSTNFSDAGPLDKYRSYEYAVSAYDAAGNYSASSANMIFAYRRFPFTLQWDDATPGTVTDMSGLSAGPASAWITATNGHLYAGASPIRFFGVNCVFEACFPAHDAAEKLAAHLAKLGVNCVRFHHMDTSATPRGIFVNVPSSDPGYRRTLDADRLDKMDYFIAQLKSRGIYANLNLHVGRYYPGYITNSAPNYFKGIDNYMPGMIALQQEYASDLLTHVNAYTGNRYADEPAVAFVEINNENGLIYQWHQSTFVTNLPAIYMDELKLQWNAWLTAKYTNNTALQAAWAPAAGSPYGNEVLTNGNFAAGFVAPWNLVANAPAAASQQVIAGTAPDGSNALEVNVTAADATPNAVQLYQTGRAFTVGQPYTVTFWAKAEAARALTVAFTQDHAPWSSLGESVVALTTEWQRFTLVLVPNATDANARLDVIGLGLQTGRVWFGSVSAKTGNSLIGPSSAWAEGSNGTEMLTNGNFAAGFVSPWTSQFTAPAGATRQLLTNGAPDGSNALEITVLTNSSSSWHVQYYQSNLRLTNGQAYTINFWAKSDPPRTMSVGFLQQVSPYASRGSASVSLATNWQQHTVVITSPADEPQARLNMTGLATQTGLCWFASHSVRPGVPGNGLPAGETLGNVSILQKAQFSVRSRAAQRDWMQFLWETEHNYWTGMRDYIRTTLGTKSLIIGTQTSYSPAPLQGELDVVDCHAYWQHPSFPGTPWDGNNWYIRNVPMTGRPDGGTIPGRAATRVPGKPFVCTEYNHPSPNTFDAETYPVLAAYAALQGWDAIFAYNYLDDTNWARGYFSSYFHTGRQPSKLVTFPLAAAIMRRGDVAAAAQEATATVPLDVAMDRVAATDAALGTTDFGMDGMLAMRQRLSIGTGAVAQVAAPWRDTNATSLVSDTGELTWDTAQSLMKLRAPFAKALIGAANMQTFDLGHGVVVTPGATMQSNHWCALSLMVRDGPGFQGAGSRILLAASGYSDNHRQNWGAGMGPTNATSMITSTNWGRAPTLMEGIPATVSLAWPARHLSVWALDTNGVRKAGVPVADVGGRGTFVIGREYQTAWYEVATLANVAPSVTITSPAGGANFGNPANITIQASASDSDGAIAKVEFFNGATKLGETNAAPYAFLWTNVTTGSYTLTARATDDELATTTSSAVNITVGVVITTGATLPGGTWNGAYSQSLSASGGTGPYSWALIGGTLPRGMSLSSSGQLSGTPTEGGTFNLTVQAADAFGVSGSQQFTLTVANDGEMDALRLKWRDMITGGSSYNPADSDIAPRITSITNAAQSNWNNMDKSPSRTNLWSDLASTNISAHVTSNYSRLRSMALAWATHGSSLENNASLLTDVIGGLDWMYANRYNETSVKYDNWWDWEIGAPQQLNDIVVLVYDALTPAQIANYMAAVEHFTPAPAYTAGNRTYTDVVVAVRGVIVKDAAKLALARDGLSPVFPYTWFEGFHVDGSFIQHTAFPYNGGYGSALLKDLGNTMWLLRGSTWEVTDPAEANSYRWVPEAYEPFIYKGACMDIVRGRGSSRSGEDHAEGHSIMQSLLRWTQLAPSGDALAFKQMLKYWMQQDTYRNFVSNIGNINLLLLAKAIRDDAGITPRDELVAHRQFPEMDRVVHLRPGFGLALSMFSTRIMNYESINGENLKGWYTADGMTYLYNGDLKQFADSFWPTVNKYRLPGTTVDTLTLTNGQAEGIYGSQSWVGGAEIGGLYGVAGMSLDSVYATLTAKKSWFMFDDEVVALGSGITSTDGRAIESIVENRKLNTSGNNALTVNGVAKSAALGWSEQMAGVSWIHLSSNAPGNHIAYYFPGGATVNGLREARTGSWRDINNGGSTNLVTRNYMTLWFDHGANPAGATYAYVLLPGKTTNEVSAYAASPHISILENSAAAQAVRETNLNITAVNFWQDTPKTVSYITCDRQGAVIAKEASGQLEVSVSDPTQANATIRQLSAIADSYVRGGIYSNENHGAESSMVVKGSSPDFTRHSYMKFDLAGSASFSSAALKVTANSAANGASTVSLYSVTVDSWTETGLTWSNRPPAVTLLGSALVSTNGQTLSFDVTGFVAGQLGGDNTASFVLVPANNDDQYLTFYTRESGSGPRLELGGVTGGGVINIELNRYATGVLSNDTRVTVMQLAPTIKLSVNVDAYPYNSDAANGIRGHSWKASFAIDNAGPTLSSVVSRKTHGAAGVFDLPLSLSGATVEPRLGGPTALIFTFAENIAARDGSLGANDFAITNAVFSGASIAGNVLTLNLASVVDQSVVTVALPGIGDVAGNAIAGQNSIAVRALYGDCNQSGSVSVSDMQYVKNRLLQPVGAGNFLADLNLSGTISVSDMQAVKNNLLHSVSAPASLDSGLAVVSVIRGTSSVPNAPPLPDSNVPIPATLGEAVSAPTLTWTTNGDELWKPTVTEDALPAARTGVIGDYQVSWVETTMSGPGTVSFEWRASSEANGDFVAFSVDGVEQPGRLSGETGWQPASFTLAAGEHRLRWTYGKSGATSVGADAAWLRKVGFQPLR